MKKMIAGLALLLALGLSACGKSDTNTPGSTATPTPSASGTTAAADGAAIYKKSCISCHGDNLQGAMGPNLQKVGSKLSKDQIVTIITNGKGSMPSFKGKLSDTEIVALADWLMTHK
jgi:mono/diheme cytochrome c family protein